MLFMRRAGCKGSNALGIAWPDIRANCAMHVGLPCRYDPSTGLLYPTPNWNLVNLTLQLLGPCTEMWLCIRLLVFQIACCMGAFVLRTALAGIYK